MEIRDGELLVQLVADISGLKSALQDATSMLKNVQGTVETLEDGVKSSTGSMGGSFAQVAAEARAMKGAIEESALESMYAMERMQGVIGKTPVTLANVARNISTNTGNMTKMTGNVLKAFDGLLESNVRNTQFLGTAINALGTQMNSSFTNGISSLRGMGGELDRTTSRSYGLVESFKQFAVQTYIIRSFVEFLGREIAGIFEPGIKFAKQMETTMYGVAAVITSSFQQGGQDVPFVRSLGMAQQILIDMKQAAIESHATVAELMLGFQEVIGPAAQVGMTIKEAEKFTVMAVQAGKTLGFSSQQLAREVRSVLMGAATGGGERSMLAGVLGLNAKDIQDAKTKAGGVYAFLEERMKGYQIAARETAGTMMGIMSNITDGIQQVQERAFESLYAGLKKEMKAVQDWFFVIKTYKEDTKDADGTVHEAGSVEEFHLKDEAVNAFRKAAQVVMEIWGAIKAVVMTLLPIFKGLWDVISSGIVLLWNVANAMGAAFSPAIAGIIYIMAGALEIVAGFIDVLNNNLAIVCPLLATFALYLAAVNVLEFLAGTSKIAVALSDFMYACMMGTGALKALIVMRWADFAATMGQVGAQILLYAKVMIIIGVIVVAIGLLVEFARHWDDVKEFALGAMEALATGIKFVVSGIVVVFANMFAYILEGFSKIAGIGSFLPDKFGGNAFKEMSNWFSNGKDAIREFSAAVEQSADASLKASQGFNRMGTAFSKFYESVKGDMSQVKEMFSMENLIKAISPEGLMAKFQKDAKDKGAGAADNAAEKAAIKEAEDIAKMQIAELKRENDELELQYKRHEIGASTYYEKRLRNIEQMNNAEQLALQLKKKIIEDRMNSLPEGKDKSNQEGQLADVNAQLKIKETEAHKAYNAELEKYDKYITGISDKVEKLNIEEAKRLGHIKEAEELEANKKYGGDISSAKRDLASAAIELGDATTRNDTAEIARQEKIIAGLKTQLGLDEKGLAMAMAKAKYDQVLYDIDQLKIQMEKAIAEEEIKDEGNKLAIEERTYQIRQKFLAQMQALIPLAKQYALAMDDPKAVQNVDKITLELKKQQDIIDDITTRLTNALTTGFEKFFEDLEHGTNRIEKAFKDLFRSILEEMNKMLIQDISTQLTNMLKKQIANLAKSLGGIMSGGSSSSPSGSALAGTIGTAQNRITNSMAPQLDSGMKKFSTSLTQMDTATKATTASTKLSDTVTKTKTATDQAANTEEKTTAATQQATLEAMNSTMVTLVATMKLLNDAALQAAAAMASMSFMGGGVTKAGGGLISGPGTGTSDSIPANLSNGEFVMTAAAVRKFGPNFFEQLNKGQVPQGNVPTMKFAAGGLAGGGGGGSSNNTNNYSVNMSPQFQSLDPATNQKMFEQHFPTFKQKMLESFMSDSVTRSVLRRAVMGN